MKVHIGCGQVYLEGYTNCDVQDKNHFLAIDRPDLVEANKTTVDKYYKFVVNRDDFISRKYNKRPVVVDIYCNAKKLPFPNESLDEIRSVQVFEHFTFKEAKQLIKHWKRKLKTRGVLHIDVPDLDETLKLYQSAESIEDRDWAIRLLFGSQKNRYGVHKMMYSKESIQKLLNENDFINIKFLPNIHTYPAFAVEALKE